MDHWYFESLRACGGARQCDGSDCARPQIRDAIATLKSGQGDQRKALRILVHLIGDVHQPSHTTENGDRGGNYVVILNRFCPVSEMQSKLCKLHTYWDNKLAKEKVHTYTGFACNVGPNRVRVGKAYDTAGAQVVARQLALAGKRLADVLNDIYKP
ncbi:hypothetical protein KGA65_16320 [Ideonella sp. B7]|uniref:S1/P1 nuclease n=1 Tax=Ideonella benzenivorans TaxID=2831643 RepID=UPI001CED1EB4|nr:S1/P1 nuclease [Ideonella benzenivorans]MCA6218101.1 hypothetical protein [Ideonella benzenivorans]